MTETKFDEEITELACALCTKYQYCSQCPYERYTNEYGVLCGIEVLTQVPPSELRRAAQWLLEHGESD